MKLLTTMTSFSLFLACSTVQAEKSEQCLKYWNKPEVEIQVLGTVDCPNIWEDKNDQSSINKKKVFKSIGLDPKNPNWMGTGECEKVKHKEIIYLIYRTYHKVDRRDIWMIYRDKDSFSYLREIDKRKLINENFSVDETVDSKINCGKIGLDKYIISVLNSYLKHNTSIKNINKYKINDWYKER